AGRPGNQTQAGSALIVRKAGDGPWTPVPLRFQFTLGNDKFFFASISTNTFQAGDVVQYYFKIDYSDRQTTFLHGSDSKSLATAEETAAQADPFTFAIHARLATTGPFLSFDSGLHQTRIFRDSGHISLAGPDLGGTPHANIVTFAPPVVEAGD